MLESTDGKVDETLQLTSNKLDVVPAVHRENVFLVVNDGRARWNAKVGWNIVGVK